jgi:hypothetical protein
VSAGIPGLGLGGLFFVLLALLAPFVELIRTMRGRSSVAAWRAVGRQFALALTMVAAVELTLRSLYALADATGLAGPLSDRSPTVVALRPIGITLGLLACVLAAAKGMQLIATVRTRGPLSVPALRALRWQPRVLGRTGALTAVCMTLLLIGPSELARAPAGGKAAANVRAPGPVPRTVSEASGIEAAGKRGSHFRGITGQPVGVEDPAARQAGSGSSRRAAVRGGDGQGPAPPPQRRGGGRGSRTPQPSPPAAAPPRPPPEVGSGETPRRAPTPGSPPAGGRGRASDDAAPEAGRTGGRAGAWDRTETPAASHNGEGTAAPPRPGAGGPAGQPREPKASAGAGGSGE